MVTCDLIDATEGRPGPVRGRNCNVHVLGSPLGRIFAAVEEDGTLVRFEFIGARRVEDFIERLDRSGYLVHWNARALREIVIQVTEYFTRNRREFDARVRLSGTPFQRMVWSELMKIPFGETLSCRDLAVRVGKLGACKAVGRANGANPISLIVPCHRVIGADWQLRGYGGGVDVRRLLALERSLPWPRQFLSDRCQESKGTP